jgi:hypothetical protein
MTEHTTGVLGRYGPTCGAEPPCCSCSSSSGRWSCRVRRSEGRGGRASTSREPLGFRHRRRGHHRPARAGHHRQRYRDLTFRVQAGILSDDRFTTVRIWRVDGALICSTAKRDDASVIAADDEWIGYALDGQTVSVPSSEGTYHVGLRRPNEELFQSFVAITLSETGTVDGVIQIDRRYSAIHNQAYRIWRPLQVVGFLLLIGVVVMFVTWLRQARRASSTPRRPNAVSGTVAGPRTKTSAARPRRPRGAHGARDQGATARARGDRRGRAEHRHRRARGARPQAARLGGRARGARRHRPAAQGQPLRAGCGRRAGPWRIRFPGRHQADQQADRGR